MPGDWIAQFVLDSAKKDMATNRSEMMNAFGLVANMPASSLLVESPIDWGDPVDWELWYRFTGPTFLSFAALFCGWWLIRYRTLHTKSSRVMFLAGVGSIAASYTAFWVWSNRNTSHLSDASLTLNMPLWWIDFYMVFELCAQWEIRLRWRDESGKIGNWPPELLGGLMFVAVLATLFLAPTRFDMWPILTTPFWVFAYLLWGMSAEPGSFFRMLTQLVHTPEANSGETRCQDG